VNAAFLQDIKEDNVHLRDLLMAASRVLDRSTWWSVKPRALADLFQQIRDQLATHFTLEEAFGYLDDAIVTAPRLSERANSLRNEHETLYISISDLADDAYRIVAERRGSTIPILLERFRSFCRKLKAHEDAENELIMESLYDELGVGD
jgi:hypothetical protein